VDDLIDGLKAIGTTPAILSPSWKRSARPGHCRRNVFTSSGLRSMSEYDLPEGGSCCYPTPKGGLAHPSPLGEAPRPSPPASKPPIAETGKCVTGEAAWRAQAARVSTTFSPGEKVAEGRGRMRGRFAVRGDSPPDSGGAAR
jgi:hypothetical protein